MLFEEEKITYLAPEFATLVFFPAASLAYLCIIPGRESEISTRVKGGSLKALGGKALFERERE